MDSNKSSNLETKYHELAIKMSKAAGIKPQQLTKVQQTIILAHLVNTQYGLQCINRNGEVIQYPQNWSEAPQGVYKFNYKMKKDDKNKKQDQGITAQFRFVDNQQNNGAISINYTLENSEELHQYELVYHKDNLQESCKNYMKNLQEKLKGKKESQGDEKPRNLEPVWRPHQQPIYNQPPYQPLPSQNRDPYRPFNMPFTGGEYIGPDNQIFRGRGTNNPLEPFNPNPNPYGSMRRPIGSRYDPIDPFGSQGVDQNPNKGKDFMGFDSFGKPLGGSGSGGFNPGRFL